MSEPTLAEMASAALPVVAKEVEEALAPEAAKVLTDLREFVAGEADKLRTELPQVVEQGTAHLHALGEAILNRYHSVMERIDAHLGGSTPAPAAPVAPEQAAAPATVESAAPAADTTTPAQATDAPAEPVAPTDTPAA